MRDTRLGFSLMELVMVLALTAIIAAIAAPRWATATAGYRADLAARRIAADLALAQNRARTTGSSRLVAFAPSASTYELLSAVPNVKSSGADYSVNLSSSPFQASLVSVDLGGDASIVFNGFGLPDSGGTVVVGCGSIRRTITINAVSGEASIK